MDRRRSLLALAAAGLCAPGRAAELKPIRSLALFPLLGDDVAVVVAAATTDTHIDRTARHALDVKDIGFDVIVADEVRKACALLVPPVKVRAFRVGANISAADQRVVVDQAHGGVLPTWAAQAIRADPPSHVLLVTRRRADAAFATANGFSVGRGAIDGIGLYIDPLYAIQDAQTRKMSQGLLGAHALLQFTLMDVASAEVVRSEQAQEQQLASPKEDMAEVDPWQYRDAAEKVRWLRDLVRRGAARAMTRVLAVA